MTSPSWETHSMKGSLPTGSVKEAPRKGKALTCQKLKSLKLSKAGEKSKNQHFCQGQGSIQKINKFLPKTKQTETIVELKGFDLLLQQVKI